VEKKKGKKIIKYTFRNIGQRCGESVESVLKKKRKATVGRIRPSRMGVLSLECKSEG